MGCMLYRVIYAQTLLALANDGVTGVTDWLRLGLELVVSSK